MRYCKRHIKGVRAGAEGWISAADKKASIALPLVAIVIPLFFSLLGEEQSFSDLGYITLSTSIAFLISVVLTGLSSLAVIWPRTNREVLLAGDDNVGRLEKSVSFFGDLGAGEYADFIDSLSWERGGEDDFNHKRWRDQMEQAYIVCKVASKKMYWMRVLVVLSGLDVSLVVLASILLKW